MSSLISHTEIESISTTRRKPKSTSMLTLKPVDFAARIQKPSQFRPPPPHKNRLIERDHQTMLIAPRTRSISISRRKKVTLEPNPTAWSNSIPHTKMKSISTPLLKSSQFDHHAIIKLISMPPRKNQVNLDPHTKQK